MKFTREKIWTLWDEMVPLLKEHWAEIARYKDIPLDPDIETYNRIEAEGGLRAYTARTIEGSLIGYAVYFVRPHLHYRASLQAVQDVLFITKDRRQGFTGYLLIKYADERLQEEGVQVVHHHVKKMHDFGLLLDRLGYEPVETVWSRRLS